MHNDQDTFMEISTESENEDAEAAVEGDEDEYDLSAARPRSHKAETYRIQV